jgi:hypothetical protein
MCVSLFWDLNTSGDAMTNNSYQKCMMIRRVTSKNETYVFWPPESDACDTRNLLETQSQERLSRLTLGTRLYLIKGGGGGRILLIVMVVAMIMTLVVRVIRGNLFDGGRHLHGTQRRVSCSSSGLLSTHPPHLMSIFSMSPSGRDFQSEVSLPCFRISDVTCDARRRRRGEWAIDQTKNGR